MKVEIYIWEVGGLGKKISIPILPEEIKCEMGEMTYATYSIMNRGDVSVPTGTGLASYSWKSEFPGELRKKDPMLKGIWQNPTKYHDILESWKASGHPLRLAVVGFPINTEVYLKSYHASAGGAYGDIAYELEFQELREIKVTKTSTSTTEEKPASKRLARQVLSYTIVSGDTLWNIAKRFYGDGNKWEYIYALNKEIIESTAKKHGKKSSENGWWIFPGVKLKIPK